MERGYTGTTIEQIAQEAGVAVETLYATFGSKRAVLSRLVGVSVVGDDEPVPASRAPRTSNCAARDRPASSGRNIFT